MALKNFTGFETGDAAELIQAIGGTGSIQASTVRSGGYALRINPSTTNFGQALFGGLTATGLTDQTTLNIATAWVRFYFQYATKPSANSEEIFNAVDTSFGIKLYLRITSTGVLAAYNSANTLLATGATALSSGTWYRIEVKIGTGASGAWEVKIDGVSEISGTANLTTVNNGYIVLGKPNDRNGNSVDFFYDDVAIDDSAYPSEGACLRFDPNSNGTYTAFAAGAGAGDYTALDDYASGAGNDGETTYSTSVTNNAQESCNLVSCATAGVNGTINAVKAIVVARDESQTVAYRIGIRSNATDRYLTAADGPATYSARVKVEAVNAGNSNAAWTTTDLDSAEVIIQHQQAQARALRVTAMALMVDFTPSNGAVTVNATGVSATGSVGTATATGAAQVTATGVSATGSLGTATATPGVTVAVTGVSATGSVGTATVSTGTGVSVSATGVSATGSVGTATATGAAQVSASGVSATGSVGTATATGAAQVSATGVSSTGSVGTATVSTGTGVSTAVSGVGATGSSGTASVTGAAQVAADGVSATGSVGDVSETGGTGETEAVTGVSATGSVGTAACSGAANTTGDGNSCSGSIGSLSVTGAANVSATGVSATGSVGTVVIETAGSVTVELEGVEATGSVGQVTVTVTGEVSTTSGGGGKVRRSRLFSHYYPPDDPINETVSARGVEAKGKADRVSVVGHAAVRVIGFQSITSGGSPIISVGTGLEVFAEGVEAQASSAFRFATGSRSVIVSDCIPKPPTKAQELAARIWLSL